MPCHRGPTTLMERMTMPTSPYSPPMCSKSVTHCKWYNSELGNSNYYTTFSVSKGVIVKTCIKFWQSLVKSRLVSNVERGTKSGRVRRELNLCVGSPVTEAYGKSDDVSESSRSYVGDGWRLCIKHREFFQNDNRK